MIAALAVIAQCVLPAQPILATAEVGELRASLTPGAVHLGSHTATGCDSLPAPHPIAIASWHDALAVGFRDGGVWTWDGATFSALAGLPDSPIRVIVAIDDTLWIGTAEGLWSIDDPAGRAKRFGHATLGRVAITALARDGNALLAGVDPRGLWRIAGTSTRLVGTRTLVGCFAGTRVRPPGPACTPSGSEVPLHVTALAEFGGHLVVGTFDDGAWEQTSHGFERIASPRLIDALLVDGDTLYAASATGLYRRTKTTAFEHLDLGLPSTHINDLVKAGDTLWLGTSRGVAAWDGRTVRMLGTGDAHVVYAITVASDGAIWAGTIGGALRFGKDGTTRFDRARGTLPGDWVTALIPDRDGAVLAGTYDSGVMRLAADGTSRALAPLDGALWINPHGLSRSGDVIAAATLGQGLQLSIGSSPTLPDTDVTSVLRIGSTTWIGTRGGLARID